MIEEARQARMLSMFSHLSNDDKDLVLKVSEVILEENKGTADYNDESKDKEGVNRA